MLIISVCLFLAGLTVGWNASGYHHTNKDEMALADALIQGYELGLSSQGDDCEIIREYSQIMWEHYCKVDP